MKSYKETIKCPNCGLVQRAKVEVSSPFNVYFHTCTLCRYEIMESEWNKVKEK